MVISTAFSSPGVRTSGASLHVLALVVLVLALSGAPAHAQATISVDAGLDGYFRAGHWLPVRVTLTNSGSPATVVVQARITAGLRGGDVATLPSRVLRSGANERHTLYARAPASFSAQPLSVDLLQDGRLLNRVRTPLTAVDGADWLVAGIGSAGTLRLLSTLTLSPTKAAPGALPWAIRNNPRVHVATLSPDQVPDRCQGLAAAHMVVLGNITERALTLEQQAAIRNYVLAGGCLVITGGPNWNRLTTPFFTSLLPVRVAGGGTATAGTHAGLLANQPPPLGRHAVVTATPLPGSRVAGEESAVPEAVMVRRLGAGSVYFLPFDPDLPPYQQWQAVPSFWLSLLRGAPSHTLFGELLQADVSRAWQPEGYGGATTWQGLADLPYSISQMDIPAFYLVALFLLAYIIVLVPVNYLFLRARDKKEWAWLTTPLIVVLFSAGAYGIGYAIKGGRTLVVRVGVMEARVGESAAPVVTYAGIFSPRKATYTVEVAPGGAGPGEADSALLCEPIRGREATGTHLVYGDRPRIVGLNVDMWAMRVLRTDGVASLGEGFQSRLAPGDAEVSGTIRNATPYAITECAVLARGVVVPIGDLPPGGSSSFRAVASAQSASGIQLSALTGVATPGGDVARTKQNLVNALSPVSAALAVEGPAPVYMAGWLREPTTRLLVSGQPAGEETAVLVLVYLGQDVREVQRPGAVPSTSPSG